MEIDSSKLIKVKDLSFRPLISEEEIQQRVKEIAAKIAANSSTAIAVAFGNFSDLKK